MSKRNQAPQRDRWGLQEPTFLERTEWPEAGAWLEAGVRQSGKSDSEIVALMDLDRGPDRLRNYYRGEHLPTPNTMRAICDAAGLSYVEAVDRFGYYREIVTIFDDLVWLGARWLEEDDARGGTLAQNGERASHLDSLRDTGVIYWDGKPISADVLESRKFLNRYCFGVWHMPEREVEHVEYPWVEQEGSSGILVPDMSQPPISRKKYVEPPRLVRTFVPKPIAVAILLATLAFPLRGDGYKEGTPKYRYDLGKAADGLVREARRLRMELRAVGRPKASIRCYSALATPSTIRRIPFNYRRPVAAEYFIIWADAICDRFTHYARLAAFDFWGEAGGHSWTIAVVPQYTAFGTASAVAMPRPSPFAMLPQARLADLPEINVFTTYQ